MEKKLLVLFVLLIAGFSSAQTVIATQGFEAGDTWTISSGSANSSTSAGSGDTPPSQRILGGTNSWQVINSSATLILNSYTVSGYTNLTVSLRLSSPATSGTNGSDATDSLAIYTSLNGGSFSTVPNVTIKGNSNARWGYTGTLTANGTSSTYTSLAAPQSGTNTNNYATVRITIPDGTTSVGLKISALNNASSEVWCVDSIKISGIPAGATTISTGAITSAPFCVTALQTASGSIAFTSTGTYTAATFTAQLSDASGSFTSPTAIGSTSVSGTDVSGSINITIPAGTPTGTGYKLRIDCADPAVTGTLSSAFTINNGLSEVTSLTAAPGVNKTTLSWVTPAGCFGSDEIMIVAKASSVINGIPVGNGSAYTASLTYGSGTAFDTGFVVYKGSVSPQMIVGLTNGTTYYFKIFNRYGTEWSAGTEISAIPAATVTTGLVDPTAFCVNSTTAATGTVAFTASGVFTNANFTVKLSDASGSFGSPITIGTLVVNGSDPTGSITFSIPAGTATGSAYKVRIDCDVPATTGSLSSAFTVTNGLSNVTALAASPAAGKVTLNWTNPTGCFGYDEVMIVAKATSSITVIPTGDGSAYTANSIFGSGTLFGTGYVVYKGSTAPQVITGLTNGTLYYFKVFTRKGTEWSSGTEKTATPSADAIVQTEYNSVSCPQFMASGSSTRIPVVFRATVTGLLPTNKYRYYNTATINTDLGGTGTGAGIVVVMDNMLGNYSTASAGSLTTSGAYTTFTTDASGNYTGWFAFTHSSNSRFAAGAYIIPLIVIGDTNGVLVSKRMLNDSIKVLAYNTTSLGVNSGTAIWGKISANAKDIVSLYDNTAGTGKPLAITYLENEDMTLASAATYYTDSVNARNGRFGTIVPNNNALGVKRVSVHSLNNGTETTFFTKDNGSWGSAGNTINPVGGTTTPLIIDSLYNSSSFTLNLTVLIQALYNGSQSVKDTIIAELHNASAPYALRASSTVFHDSLGYGQHSFTALSTDSSYYIVVKHRNAIETWSGAPVSFTGGVCTYDFTTAGDKAYASNMVDVSSKYCIFSGDVNNDGFIDFTDLTLIDNDAYNFVSGYADTDVNGDEFIDFSDLSIVDNNAYNFIGKISPADGAKK